MPLASHIKPEPSPPLDRARVIRAREMYAEGFTVSRILAHCQMSYGTLYACLDGAPFGADGEHWPKVPRRRKLTDRRRRTLRTDSVSLVNRLLRTIERMVRDIETRLSARELPSGEWERSVRTLASLSRAMRHIEAVDKPAQRGAVSSDDEEDMLPADIDAVRRELEHKLAAMAAAGPPDDPET